MFANESRIDDGEVSDSIWMRPRGDSPQRDFGLPVDETTLPEALAALGYQHRGAFGKWHLGHRRAKWHPLFQGFTHFHGHYNGAIDYFKLTRENERDWHVNFEASGQQGYATHLIAQAASDWISEKSKESSPYFCYISFNAPHAPYQAPADSINRFKSLATGQSRRGNQRKQAPERRAVYAAMIWEMDKGIGEILEAVEASGESENTIVWFFSDNGGVGNIAQNNTPLRGSKLTVYEGGIRVPAAVVWPNRLPAGTKLRDAIGYIDVLPTLIGAGGGDPREIITKPLDGADILPVLLGVGQQPVWETISERPWFSYHGQAGPDREHLAVTKAGWKLKVHGPVLKSVNS